MTDQKKPTEIADEALEDAAGGLFGMAGAGSEVKLSTHSTTSSRAAKPKPQHEFGFNPQANDPY